MGSLDKQNAVSCLMDTQTPDGVVRHSNSLGGDCPPDFVPRSMQWKSNGTMFSSHFFSSSVSRMIPRTLALSGNVGMGEIPKCHVGQSGEMVLWLAMQCGALLVW
jgi:hypothetical protein